MKLNTDEFRALQSAWYEKLSNSGFKDVESLEGGELSLKESTYQCYLRKKGYLWILSRRDYFRGLAQAAHQDNAYFRNETDRFILIRYCEGAKICTIVSELILRKEPLRRQAVRFIIRRYEMLWGFKHYEPKKLGKYR